MKALAALTLASIALPAAAQTVTPVAEGVAATPLPMRVVGRSEPDGALVRRQWPGTRFETGFTGRDALFRVGPGEVILSVRLDDAAPVRLVKPAPGLYRVAAPTAGRHRLRLSVVSESQAGPTAFGGFLAPAGTAPAPVAAPARRIEFIGDSHTVGYGNRSTTRDCSEAQVWETTDTEAGIAGLLGQRYGADVRVHAISGRGVVRNYDGFAAPTLPEAYPYVLFDRKVAARDTGWTPQLVVMALGTNDFSTPLKAGERWADRAALHAAFEDRYVAFVGELRARYPRAQLVLWATDLVNGEIDAEVRRVVARLRAGGERRVAYVPVAGLSMQGCHFHPSTADDARIAAALATAIDAVPTVWRR